MMIKSFSGTVLRLLVSPISGVIEGYKEANSRPPAANLKQFVVNYVKDYFLPLTGAINGVKKELGGKNHDSI